MMSTSDSTALIARPIFSDDDNADNADLLADLHGDVHGDDGGEQTNPNQLAHPSSPQEEGPTGRFDLDSMDGYDDMPSAHVSVFDVSDLDGDVEEGGAATTIMQLPPSMMAAHPDKSVDEKSDGLSREAIDLMKWRAGPSPPVPGLAGLDDVAFEAVGFEAADDGLAATLPALSLEAVRAAALAAGVPMPMPPMPSGPPPTKAGATGTLSVGITAEMPALVLADLIDEALAAVLAAQSAADGGQVPRGLHDHLARAVELLSTAQELADRQDP